MNPRLPDRSRRDIEQSLAADIRFDFAEVIEATRPSHDSGVSASVTLDASMPATVILSSGSTTFPKAVVHTLSAHLANAAGAASNMPLSPHDGWLWSLPLYHVSGLAILFRVFTAGATLVIPRPRADLHDAITLPRVTHLSLVQQQLRRLLMARTRCPPGIKAVLLGGSSYARELVDRSLLAGYALHTTYGMTETASQVTATPPGASADQLMSAGRLLPFRELKIDDQGEIHVRGDVLCLGYRRGQDVTALINEFGWFPTGDLGRWTAGGWLTILGRRDNMFISGGENIHPEEIEAALLEITGIRQALVVAASDDEYGQRPVAIVDADELRPRDFASSLREKLPAFKVPNRFYRWPAELQNTIKPSRSVATLWVQQMGEQ
jgi:O-succinylbenzoic acid--CoA ligase